ncbi:S24/S26 family peptidase, partial [Desulfobulbus sp. N2]|nr:S24/S26 family peptidase [Desulfobulbus sp. N2]
MKGILDDIKRRDKVLRELAADTPLRFRTQGCCMSPLLEDGAVVEITNKRFYWPGDVLVFRHQDGHALVHRLIGYAPCFSGIRYITKADRAFQLDASVGRQQILGVVKGGDVAPALANVPFAHRVHSPKRVQQP